MLLSIFLVGVLALPSDIPPVTSTIEDTITLKEVVISSKLKRFSAGLSVKIISPIDIKQSRSLLLSDMLASQPGLVVNSYGPGATSSISLRGLNASHTAVLWNGVNLQSSMNSGVNFGNIPTFFVDQIAVQQGGNGALFGSGAIGGVIHLDNQLAFGNGNSGELFQSVGSYGLSYSAIKHTYGGEKFAISSRLFYSEAQNNYEFRNTTKMGKPIVNQTNANYRKAGIMETASFLVSPADRLVVALWAQDGYNAYPAMMSTASSNQNDYSSFFRATSQWRANRTSYDFNIKAALFNDWQAYRNIPVERSNHHSTNGQVEGEFIYRMSQSHVLEAGINTAYERVRSTNYSEPKERLRPAATLGYRFRTEDGGIEAFAGAREEIIDGESTPITWSVGGQFRLMTGLYMRANVSRNYRVPSFNDLYWGNGWGNPNLKPENGLGEEVGLDYVYTGNGNLISIKISAFNNNVDNWIIWLPNSSGTWRPQNYNEVWSRGVESSLTLKKRLERFTIGADLSGAITYTTNEKDAIQATEGKQLPYVPKYKYGFSAFIDFDWLRLKYTQGYTGRRYDVADHSSQINPFSIASLSVETNYKLNSYEIRGFARIDNLWNEEYVVMQNYGMPMRTYQLGIVLSFGK
ncbi:TonB-dependent receptor plug domain-containing protein [Williamwhitmania taraxaci]|uniref:Outer membrane cobalamin receptor protein n=1 Tax=Williamwhitmania taraxaci TaxID=1640674 RepID=A0A1G6J5C7_9BACT|nr:TonB-dependent receptor [Williamwhitmania taraxaci]SDC13176.1 Outer membrane cobalamin receptor protein [Williamwhitmania taraxaci]